MRICLTDSTRGQRGGAPVLQAAYGWILKGHVLVRRPRPMGQGVVWRVRPRGTFALGSGRRDFLSTVELRGDGGVEVAGGEGTEEEGAGGLEVVRRLAGGGVGEGGR